MTVRKILRFGDPLLLQRSQEITHFSADDSGELQKLIDDMQETMLAHDGAGLAAPQIGVLKRLVIFGSKEPVRNPRYPEADYVPYTILINPEITTLSQTVQGMWEGCLSVPGMLGFVERPDHIIYSGYNQFGEIIEREVTGFHAIVVQHECDHLDGMLYPMKLKDPKMFGYNDEIYESLSEE